MKKGRITRNSEYRQVFASGASVVTRGLVLYRVENGQKENRAGFVVSKKNGNAVIRNRIKRLCKEAYRYYANELTKGYDLVFIARAPAAKFDFTQAATEMERILKRGGLFKVISGKN
ncbi:MAG: ribonuclease P protein component [Dethiobacter sp.]|jgi:ribonuclease P protein component|nr:ribonuclease P protein component [Dethiobacter sp.]MBS3982892.1 ribonuclease P protein component [Dethiobacter sp.]MCL4463002.1 ribonuclease P protein component [Bacillota bacterium]MCL5994254.1 ribonuclease P protein component [Bacillota bacterium]